VAGMQLVLWDIDHTLIETRGVGYELFGKAFLAVTGRPMKQQAELTGRTEPDIFRDTLALHGIDQADGDFPRFAAALADAYETGRATLRQRGRALKGAREALDALARRREILQSVLTGNIRSVAVTKLATFELDRYVDFDIGAYGSDAADRPGLVEIAQRRAAAKHGASLGPRNTVLVGDSPADVAAGLAGGAKVIGIASGRSSVDELRDAGADSALPDLTDTDALLSAILR
jgi:phosphoglycolate phosphatase